MIGFDRPLRPKWIYEVLNMIEPGKNPSDFNLTFENIANELVGKEGKRKVRTVLFRSFIFSFQEQRNKIENNLLIDLSREKKIDYMKPIYLIKLIMDYEIIRFIINKMELLFSSSQEITTPILTKKMVQEYGDRDVVPRSVRSFLKTLEHFGILLMVDSKTARIINNFQLNEEQLKDVLILYAKSYIKSNIIDLQQIDKTIFAFNDTQKFDEVAMQYNGTNWEYVKEYHRSMLILKNYNNK